MRSITRWRFLGAAIAAGFLSSQAHAALVITPAAGYTINWNGNDGDFFSASNPALAPINLARASSGSTPFASSQFGANHLTVKLNDGSYGNTDSWIANPGDVPTPAAGVSFPALQNITQVAWGRDNGNNAGDCCGGQLMDRSLGVYTLQRTTVAAPGAGTAVTGNAATGWENIGTLSYNNSADTVVGGGFSAFLRHQYDIAFGGAPVAATGLRITAPNGTAIDEIEAYSGLVDTGVSLISISAPGVVPNNLALSSNGSTAFAKNLIGNGAYAPTHTIPNLNDGVYGNSDSWIGHDAGLGDAPDGNPNFAGVAFAAPTVISQIAFGRDSDGVVSFADRAAGTYLLQYTTAAGPSAATPDASWLTLGSVTYDVSDPQRFLRHLYGFNPVLATGVRIVTMNGEGQIAIDEIEVFPGQLTAAALPEPATLSLLGLGMLAIARRTRREV